MVFGNRYKKRRILITGHTGFKGSWLAIWLKELGAEVVGYALEPPSDPSNYAATGLADRINHVHGDVRDLDHLMDVFARYEPEMVFHLAAQALVRSSYEDPKTTFDTNIGGTVNVLEAVRRTDSVRVLVNITSDKCYENREWVWGYRENDPMGGHDPYSASKGAAELVFAAYLRSFFSKPACGDRQLGAASCRAGNAIGGGDWGRDRLIPDCIRALAAGEDIGIRNPRAIRPWQHVLELLSGYLWLGARLWTHPEAFNGGWNFGPPGEAHMTVGEVVNRLLRAWGSGAWRDLSPPEAVHEAATLRLCCDKAASCLGWRNALSLDEAIEMTAAWYNTFYSGVSQDAAYHRCTRQIAEYIEKAKEKKLKWAAEKTET
ncbi:MAG TPA: CDP-glucose 4,6-dehydratase [Smithellaceae bacterium]|nr:CDP-glucose 4,6-dehydratase [Smithellaceae bacterium]